MFREILKKLGIVKEKQQSTEAYCDCGHELCGEKGNIIKNDLNAGLVIFKCGHCGKQTEWDFAAPAPIRLGDNA